jgi:hypothetical protein
MKCGGKLECAQAYYYDISMSTRTHTAPPSLDRDLIVASESLRHVRAGRTQME